MRQIQNKSFGRKVLETILGLATPVLAVISPGCITSGYVTPELGVNIPTSQRGNLVQYDNAVTYGVRGGVKTKKGVEIEVGYRGHNANWNDAFQENDVKVDDLSVSAIVPLARKRGTVLHAVAEITSRSEKEDCWLIGIPGSELTENRSSTGFGVGVGARFQAGKGSVDTRLTYEGFGEGSYEESGVRADVGYTFSW